MSIESDIRFLARQPFFAVLGADALRNLAIGAQTLTVGPGSTVFEAGDHADGAIGVVEGALSLTDRSGQARVVAEPGTVIGEMALLTPGLRGMTATAPDGATLLILPRQMFLRMLEGFPSSAAALRDLIARMNDQTIRELDRVRLSLAVSAMQDETVTDRG
jgi:CRP-like cAMP-binding protein